MKQKQHEASPTSPRTHESWTPPTQKIRKQTLHRLRHRDRDRRRRVRTTYFQSRRLDRELVLDDRLTPLGRDSGLLEDRGLEGRRL